MRGRVPAWTLKHVFVILRELGGHSAVLYVNRYHNYLFVPFLLDLTFQLFVDDNNIISSVDA